MFRITRRELAVALGTAVAPLPAQQTSGDLLEEARGNLKKTIDGLRQFKLDISVEPAFVFKP